MKWKKKFIRSFSHYYEKTKIEEVKKISFKITNETSTRKFITLKTKKKHTSFINKILKFEIRILKYTQNHFDYGTFFFLNSHSFALAKILN